MRYKILYFIIAFFCLAAVARLVDLQLVHGEEYESESRRRLLRTSVIVAPRGDILDRNGEALVKNKTAFSIEIHQIKGMNKEERNRVIASLIKECENYGKNIVDTFPISKDSGEFTLSDEEIKNFKGKYNLDKNCTTGEVLSYFASRYSVDSSFSDKEKRDIIGVRYEMERTDFSENNPYTFADDISFELLTRLKEQAERFPGVIIVTKPIRQYVYGNTASHILGRTGKIYKEEYELLAEKDYMMNDIIGKQGVEKLMEDSLRGKDGLGGIEQSVDGRKIKIVETVAPEKGDNVVLTIDLKMQQAAETSLKNTIDYIHTLSAGEPNGAGFDADSGAVVAIDVNTGDILAIASYPDYDPARFNEDYEKLSENPAKPMFNRAIGGVYEPGSTFKMVTAVSALQEGVITKDTYIEDKGIYKFYPDYRPRCWVYSKGVTHGYQNVSQALENSCNYFFYETGRLTGIDKLNYYARKFGLGLPTGIELTGEESIGILAGREEREKQNLVWNPGDTLQAAIGQSDNLFTPLQMANYLATLVNGGTRYRTHLIKTVRDADDGRILYESGTEVMDTITISDENYNAVMSGMKNVVELGTASDVFDNFSVSAGGKTGTAEIANGSSNAIFVGFAPYDNPQIAVCCVIEHGAHGANAGYVVRDVLDAYFNSGIKAEKISQKNVLTR